MKSHHLHRTPRLCSLVTLVVATLACVLPALGQTNTGSIQGVVYDESMAVMPGVKVTASDLARGVERTVVTSEAGDYALTLLMPGEYLLLFEAESFAPLTVEGFEV